MITLDLYEKLGSLPKPGSKGDHFKNYRSKIPDGESGPWKVSTFEIKKDFELLRMMSDGRGTPLGFYKRLTHNGHVIMSDTNAEINDHLDLFGEARGKVLIHGLGLGVAVCGCLAKKEVESVEVVEIDADVIALVAPHIKDKRLTVYHDDALARTWPKGAKWNVVWHDIWPDICGDNLGEMARLERAFKRRCQWQGCWAKEWIR